MGVYLGQMQDTILVIKMMHMVANISCFFKQLFIAADPIAGTKHN